MEEQEVDEIELTYLQSHELLLMSLTNSMTKIKKVRAKKSAPRLGLPKCHICNKVCSNNAALASHKAVHLDTAEFKCTKCTYKGKTKKYLARHMSKVHTEPTKYKCEECGKKFHFLNRLESHRRVHTGEKPFQCKHCGKTFSARYSLNTHLLLHTDEKPFKCSFCEYACRDSSTLRKHQHRHMGLETVYQCKKCDKSFKRKYVLKNHVAEAHLNLELQRHKCTECERQFKRKGTLTQHIKAVHRKVMRCECRICGMMISSKYNMKIHLRVHTEVRPYQCDYEGCEKSFKDQSSMKKHHIIHFPSKHFPCKVCGKLFSRERRLKYHMAQHRERIRNVECQYCGVCFYNEVYLQLHYKKKHDRKRKRYKCDLCDFITSNKPSIVMHLKYGHAKDGDVECKLCNIRFKKHEYLKMHFTRTHNMRYKPIKREKKKPKKRQIIIKEEPMDSADEKEIMELLTDVTQGREEQRTEESDTILYSDAVFSEDVAKSYIRHNSEKLTKLPEDVFDTFFIEHVYKRYVEREEKSSTMDREEEERGIKRYKELLSEIIGGTEIDITDAVREKSAEEVRDCKVKLKRCDVKYMKIERSNKRLSSTSGGANETDLFDRARKRTTKRRSEATQSQENIKNNVERNKVSKIKLNTHQCYVCSKVFETKHQVTKHCSQHFGVRNETQLKKCPLCIYVTREPNFSKHMRKVHKMQISCNYGAIQEKDKKYTFKGSNGYDIEIIPSVENLNEREDIKIDKGNDQMKEKCLTKTKLVKLGNEWVIQKEILPKKDFVVPSLKECNKYLEVLKEKYRECKRRGEMMLFPCQFCEKTCRTLSALTLHLRKHQNRPKPFKKKTWKHKFNNHLNVLTKEKIKVTDILIDGKCLRIVLKDCMKNNSDRKEKLSRTKEIRDPLADPKPVTSKHRCDKELIEFYKNNIKGSDIEFWQFLKIFNKMSRENIDDFEDLESRYDFGMHLDNRIENITAINPESSIDKTAVGSTQSIQNSTREQTMSVERNKNITKETTKNVESNQNIIKENAQSVEMSQNFTKVKVNNNRNSFKRVILLSKSEYNKRQEIKMRMREKILREQSSK